MWILHFRASGSGVWASGLELGALFFGEGV